MKVLIYDGECRFCSANAERIRKWDKKNIFSFVSLHDPEVKEKWPELDQSVLTNNICICSEDKKYFGVDAIKYLSTKLPVLFFIRPLFWFPFLPVWRLFYKIVARNRFIFGRINCDTKCKI